MSKRTADDGGNGSSQPPIKKVHFEPHLIGPVSTLEEMDIKVLQFQNKKLAQVRDEKYFCFICNLLWYLSVDILQIQWTRNMSWSAVYEHLIT